MWGQGTMVTVTSAEQSAPSLFPLISCGTSQESTVTIGCLAKDFLPDSISFSWTDKSNNSFTNGFKKYNSVLQTTGTYAAGSQIKVTSDSWNKADTFYCVAKTAANTKALGVVLPKGNNPREPTVTMNPPLKYDLEMNGKGVIACIAGGFSPPSIKVSWRVNHKETNFYIETEEVSPDGNGNFTIRSFITAPKKDWNEDAVFTCVVEHPPSVFLEMRNLSKSQVCDTMVLPDSLQVIAIPPSFETMFLTKTAPLTCLVTNMGSVDGLDISWYEQASETKLNTMIESPVYHENGTYTAKAVTSVCVDDWLKKAFTCIVRHPELATPMQVTLVKENGQAPKTPQVLLYSPHQDDINMGEHLTLLCLVKGFYPKDIFVKWLIGDKVEEVNVVNTAPIEETTRSGEKTYFTISKLTILNVADWNSGQIYTCLAGHESLPLQATQRSIDKTSGEEYDNLWTTASTFIVLFLLSLLYSATVTLFKV